MRTTMLQCETHPTMCLAHRIYHRKGAALGDGISAGSASTFRESSDSPPPRRSKARPTVAPWSNSDQDSCSHEKIPRNISRPPCHQYYHEGSNHDATQRYTHCPIDGRSQLRRYWPYQLVPRSFEYRNSASTEVQLLYPLSPLVHDGIACRWSKPNVWSVQQASISGSRYFAPRFDNEQWQALIALHRSLLHERRNSFLATQHPFGMSCENVA